MTAKNSKPVGASDSSPTRLVTKFILIHGDKGGVGKSFVGQALTDFLYKRGDKVAIIDADTQNPDVSRMFANVVPVAQANVRSENGWMDVMDFVTKHPGYTIIMNTPAGIGEYMKADMASFTKFLEIQETPVEIELWWTMNIQHDSVNLLNEAYKSYGEHFARIRVVCNLHFANNDKSNDGPFLLWNDSPLRTNIEKKGGMTLYFPGLHIRAVVKLFAPGKSIPFSEAVDAALGESVGLSNSERWKLMQWMDDVTKLFAPAFESPVVAAA